MKKTTIAIFEDDVVNRFIYERLLNRRKDELQVHIFDTPEKGIALAREVTFDIVYIELHFWETFGGLAILKRLREICPKEMIAVAMTSLLQEGDLEYILAAGFNLCLEKPVVFSSMDLSNLI
jgi:CheY-like chemotaxis protein